ncbi:MAG TPA: hypothetical protein PLP33_24515 [Leptospiraceae bacterium]|nr:hypothetical protein [Leptospiraceae bacterium]
MENKEIKDALEKKEEAAWELIRAAIALFKAVDYDPGLHQVAEVIDTYYSDVDAGKQMLDDFREKICALEKANEDFLKVVKEQQKQVDIFRKYGRMPLH